MNKKKLFILFFVFSILFFAKKVKATEFVDVDNSNNYVGNTEQIGSASSSFIQSFSPGQDNITKIKVFLYGSGYSSGYELYLCRGLWGSDSVSPTCQDNNFIASSTWNSIGDAYFYLPVNTKVQVGTMYYFSIRYKGLGHYGLTQINNYPTSDSIIFSYFSHVNSDGTLVGDWSYNHTWTLRFQTYYSDVPINTIKFVSPPLPSSKAYKDFSNFVLEYTGWHADNDPNANCLFRVDYCIGTSTTYSMGCYTNNSLLYGATNKQIVVQKPFNLKDGTYKVKADLYDVCNTIPKASTSQTLLIDSIGGLDVNSISSTTLRDRFNEKTICNTIATSTGGLDDVRFALECGFKRVMIFSFLPSDDSLNYISDSFNNLKLQFPFSVYYDITTSVNTAVSSSTNVTTGSFKMPMVDKYGHYYMLPVLTSSSVPNLIGSDNTTLFRNSLGWIMWAICGFIIFIQFKKI